MMSRFKLTRKAFLALVLSVSFVNYASAQESLSSSLKMSVFPSGGQDSSQQSKDEGECYGWAVNNTGSDPFDLQKQQSADAQAAAQQKQQIANSGGGSGARGALRGAAVGAVAGEVFNDNHHDGAKTGAAVGFIAGRRGARKQKEAAAASVEQAAAANTAATEQQIGVFKNSFSACLESKKYTVKY